MYTLILWIINLFINCLSFSAEQKPNTTAYNICSDMLSLQYRSGNRRQWTTTTTATTGMMPTYRLFLFTTTPRASCVSRTISVYYLIFCKVGLQRPWVQSWRHRRCVLAWMCCKYSDKDVRGLSDTRTPRWWTQNWWRNLCMTYTYRGNWTCMKL